MLDSFMSVLVEIAKRLDGILAIFFIVKKIYYCFSNNLHSSDGVKSNKKEYPLLLIAGLLTCIPALILLFISTFFDLSIAWLSCYVFGASISQYVLAGYEYYEERDTLDNKITVSILNEFDSAYKDNPTARKKLKGDVNEDLKTLVDYKEEVNDWGAIVLLCFIALLS